MSDRVALLHSRTARLDLGLTTSAHQLPASPLIDHGSEQAGRIVTQVISSTIFPHGHNDLWGRLRLYS